MISKNDGGSDWGEYRNNQGEFRAWLHTFGFNNDGKLLRAWAPLPWVCREAPSGEFLTAVYHMGLTKQWPGEWPRWHPVGEYNGLFFPQVVYGAVLDRRNPAALEQAMNKLRRQFASREDFLAKLIKSYVLFTKEKLNANTRSSQAGSASV